jgi:creatinine amidohydrolase/Fe(II)-dependent formamide hydrolase-like protein
MPRLRNGGIAAVSPVGVLGNPTTASAEDGSRIFAEMVETCTRRVAAWTPGAGGLLQ